MSWKSLDILPLQEFLEMHVSLSHLKLGIQVTYIIIVGVIYIIIVGVIEETESRNFRGEELVSRLAGWYLYPRFGHCNDATDPYGRVSYSSFHECTSFHGFDTDQWAWNLICRPWSWACVYSEGANWQHLTSVLNHSGPVSQKFCWMLSSQGGCHYMA